MVIESATLAISLSLWEIRIEVMPCVLKLEQQVEQGVAVGLVQARGRLVEDQQLDLLRQRLGDLDQLLLADADVGDQRVRRFSSRPTFCSSSRVAAEGGRPSR